MRCKLISLVIAAAALIAPVSTLTATAEGRRQLPLMIAGADMSVLPVMESQGVVYKIDGRPVDPIQALAAHGFNCVRLRLWVHPSRTDVLINDLPTTIKLAQRAKQAGMLVLLDIHYADTWADAGKQPKPDAWSNLPFDELTTAAVHDYSREVITAMRKAGAMPDIVQVGNEITGGMLWPDGKDWGAGHDFKNLSILLKSGIRGVKDGAGSAAQPWIMIHIDKGGDWSGTQWFFDGIGAEGVQFDIIGESYYPQFQGAMSGLRTTLTNAATRYGKPIVVVETAYPFEPNGQPLKPAMTYPATPAGQLQFMHDLIDVVDATPNGLGQGIVYWEPDWVPTKQRGAWNTTGLFDDSGNALPAFYVFDQLALGRDAQMTVHSH